MLIVQLILINIAFIVSFILLLPSSPWLFTINSLLLIFLAAMRYQYYHRQTHQILQTLLHGLRNLQDGDFSISLVDNSTNKSQIQSEVLALFNQVTDKLRQEKQSLYQRELLLDKVVNASDVVTVLVNHRDSIIFANRAAEYFFNQKSMLGMSWATLLDEKLPELIPHHDKDNAIIQLLLADANQSNTSVTNNDVSIGSDGEVKVSPKTEQSWHLSRHHLKLDGSRHQLTLLKPITQAMHKQELQTWKKVIRVINQELNNSIAPISSMCHSGNILAERLNEPQLIRVFATISKRINKLAEFIQSYSQLARLSKPQKQPFDLIKTLKQLQDLYRFTLNCQQTSVMFSGDESQIEQLLINLLKNAQQACPEQDNPEKVCVVSLSNQQGRLIITIRDFGTGMPTDVLQKAFLPYYSTKADGSGIGLSICREISDGHQGQITLNNHAEGGLQVEVHLPLS
jgi:two-component system nitrogen regulation sensor histidine kinase NtrY